MFSKTLPSQAELAEVKTILATMHREFRQIETQWLKLKRILRREDDY